MYPETTTTLTYARVHTYEHCKSFAHGTLKNTFLTCARVQTYEHCDGSAAAGGSGGPAGVDGNISCNHNGISTVPGPALDPVDRVEQRRSATVASIDAVHSLQ